MHSKLPVVSVVAVVLEIWGLERVNLRYLHKIFHLAATLSIAVAVCQKRLAVLSSKIHVSRSQRIFWKIHCRGEWNA